ncbi:MAG: hypothetical protein N3C12_02685 [Candidatus Binatia bacterium]|nr:hypothetical protein [Candidatus Binatia bacterium]
MRLSLNNRDPRLPTCTASGVSVVDVRRPSPRTGDATDITNASALAAALGSGPTGLSLILYLGGVLAESGAPVFAHNQCSGEITFAIPLRMTAQGWRP